MKTLNVWAASLAILTLSSGAMALDAPPQPVKIELKAFKVTSGPNGKETTTEAKQARPNDLIEYRATYANVSPNAVRGLAATLPIPADMQFTGTALPEGAEASTDGRSFAAMPLKRKVGDKVVNVPLGEYRALRWKVPELAVGKSVNVSVRARVNGNAPAASPTQTSK